VGSFSTKYQRKYEVIFNSPGGHCIAAYFNFTGFIGQHATVSFHPTIVTPVIGGGFRENADQQIYLPAPHPILFCIINRTFNILLQPHLDIYLIQWSQDYDIVVGGLVWETFINQEQLSRSTILQPLDQHNLLNDGQDDDDDDDENP
jgi:hypothetical protein